MLDKILEFVIGFLILNRELNSQNSETHLLASNIGKKISIAVAFFMMGIILSISIVYAIFQLGDAYNFLLSRYENAVYLKIISYTSAIVVGCGVFFLYIKNNQTKNKKIENKNKRILEDEMQLMIFKFLDGFRDEVRTKNES